MQLALHFPVKHSFAKNNCTIFTPNINQSNFDAHFQHFESVCESISEEA